MDLFSTTFRAWQHRHPASVTHWALALTLIPLAALAGCTGESCDDAELCDYTPSISDSKPAPQTPPPFEGQNPFEDAPVDDGGNQSVVTPAPALDGNGGQDFNNMNCDASTPADYRDQDGDGFCPKGQDIDGDGCCLPRTPNEVTLITTAQDCDDTRASVNPNAQERCTNRDDNCNGEIDEGGVCPEGCEKREVQGHLFLFCHHRATWDNAQNFCAGAGMHLAHIDNVEQDNAFTANLNDGQAGAFWLGGRRDPGNLDYFRWVHGNRHFSTNAAPHEGAYVNWNKGEPNNHRGGEHCVQRRQNYGDRGWNDVKCSESIRFLCRLSE